MTNHLAIIALLFSALTVAPTASAQTTFDLLEQGIYTEQTIGDLDEAIEIYEQVLIETDVHRVNAANALLRLGICYQKLGNTEKAAEYFEQLVGDYPDQTQIVADAQSQLKELNMVGLELLPAPWQSGDAYSYEVLSPAGKPMGIMEYQITKEFVDGNPQWDIHTFMGVMSNFTRYGSVEISAESFKPIRSEMNESSKGSSESIYQDDEIQVISEDSDTTITQPGAIYDGQQFLSLLQRLPLWEGYQEEVQVLYSTYGSYDTIIKVLGVEEIKVPAGTFESYHLEHQTLGGEKTVKTQEYWVSTGSEREVLKYNNQDIQFQLTRSGQREGKNSPLYSNPGLGVTFSAVGGWLAFDDSLDDRAARVYLYPEEAGLVGEFTARLIPPHQLESHTAAHMAENHQNQNNRFFKDYVVRPESEIDLEIAGVPARSYIADFEFQGKKMFEYRTILRTENMGYWFTFRGDPDAFEANKDQLDFITTSLVAP